MPSCWPGWPPNWAAPKRDVQLLRGDSARRKQLDIICTVATGLPLQVAVLVWLG
jgi:uncharacterized protein YggU (UPF0235/DUF167 family)